MPAPPTKFAVFPPGSEMYGYGYSEWSARWRQWALSLPMGRNPFFDEVGCLNGDQGQEGPVWFLTGVFNETGIAVRECTIPAGKSIFLPVLNLECSTIEAPPWYGTNEQELCDCAKQWWTWPRT
jgi:hypothetical protein